MNPKQELNLVFGIHPSARGFGWVMMESPTRVVDWGTATAGSNNHKRLLNRLDRILKRHAPDVIVLEDFDGASSRRAPRIQALCREIMSLALQKGADLKVYPRHLISLCLTGTENADRFKIANQVAAKIELFQGRVPRKRKPWENVHTRQPLFDAASLALTYYTVMGEIPDLV